jgi:hypothetical protein
VITVAISSIDTTNHVGYFLTIMHWARENCKTFQGACILEDEDADDEIQICEYNFTDETDVNWFKIRWLR